MGVLRLKNQLNFMPSAAWLRLVLPVKEAESVLVAMVDA
jgi:hypothetical protein